MVLERTNNQSQIAPLRQFRQAFQLVIHLVPLIDPIPQPSAIKPDRFLPSIHCDAVGVSEQRRPADVGSITVVRSSILYSNHRSSPFIRATPLRTAETSPLIERANADVGNERNI